MSHKKEAVPQQQRHNNPQFLDFFVDAWPSHFSSQPTPHQRALTEFSVCIAGATPGTPGITPGRQFTTEANAGVPSTALEESETHSEIRKQENHCLDNIWGLFDVI